MSKDLGLLQTLFSLISKAKLIGLHTLSNLLFQVVLLNWKNFVETPLLKYFISNAYEDSLKINEVPYPNLVHYFLLQSYLFFRKYLTSCINGVTLTMIEPTSQIFLIYQMKGMTLFTTMVVFMTFILTKSPLINLLFDPPLLNTQLMYNRTCFKTCISHYLL